MAEKVLGLELLLVCQSWVTQRLQRRTGLHVLGLHVLHNERFCHGDKSM